MTPEELRQQIREKYGFPPEVSDADAARMLNDRFEDSRGAWRNEAARAAARKAYLMEVGDAISPGKFDEEVALSRVLVDPDTREAMPLLADSLFLSKYAERDSLSQKPQTPPAYSPPFGAYLSQGVIDASSLANAEKDLAYLTEHHDVISNGGFAHPEHRSLMHRALDPESATGQVLGRMGLIPESARMSLGGERRFFNGDALGAAAGNLTAAEKYRAFTPTPVMELPDDTPREEINAARKQMRSEQSLAASPQARERWLKTTGWNPPDWLAFASDLAVDYLDPTVVADFAFPTLAAVKRGAKAFKGGLLGGLKATAKDVGLEIAPDVAVETGVGFALTGDDKAYGMENGKPRLVKNDEELKQANNIRQRNETERLPEARQEFNTWASERKKRLARQELPNLPFP